MLDAMRSAIQVSNHIAMLKKEPYKPINYIDAFHLATIGGAKGEIFIRTQLLYIYELLN